MMKIAIVGAGKAGMALLDILHNTQDVKPVGIIDKDAKAPGLSRANKWGIPVAKDLEGLYSLRPDIIIDATGVQEVTARLTKTAPAGTKVIDSTCARLLWNIGRKHSSRKEMETIYLNGVSLTSSKNLKDVLSTTLEKAMELTDTPAGSIALCERGEMKMAAARGFSSELKSILRWKIRPEGLTNAILSTREPFEVRDIRKHHLFDNDQMVAEGIRSILAFSLRINGDTVGILYLDDFRSRKFSERHKNLIRLFGMQAAQAIDKFRILDELYKVIADLDNATAYLKNVLDDSQDMIMTTDTEGRIVELSKGGERILGYTREEITGIRAADLYEDKEERAKILDIIKSRGALYNHETRLFRKDGVPVDISLTISQLKSQTGKVIGTVGISKDITQEKLLRKELELNNQELENLNMRLEDKVLERTRELERINRELLKANETKARFISNMSHELRTPLNSILGFSEILFEKTFGDLNDKQLRHVSNILSSGKHLLQLVNNILDIAKIEAGKLELFYEDFNIRDAVDEVVMIMNSLAMRKSISINVDVSPEAGIFSADKVKFKQMLYNFVSNAIKFTPEGGEVGIRAGYTINKGAVLPWALEGQKLLTVSVWDKGIGIREEDINRIFDEFEQVDPSMSRKHEGTGLGLALTRRLVEIHGGQTSVKSVYGEGSEFTFYLPALPEKKKPENGAEEYSPVSIPLLTEEAPLVLVVEDDLPTSEILTIHLTKGGYKVAHAYDGVEAISKAKELRPFVITLDVMLPRKDGWEVLQSLKADSDTKDIPVIIHSIVDNKDLAYALGATDYLLKPVDKAVLLGKLNELALFIKRDQLPVSMLLISGDEVTKENIRSIFEKDGVLFLSSSTQDEGLALASDVRPHIIMLDMETCDFNMIKQLKKTSAISGIPIFALTNKDLSMEERLSLTGQIERVLKKDDSIDKDLVMHLKDLEVMHPRRAGLIDDLTGLFTHRYFQLRLAQELSRSARYMMPLTLVLLDIDNFGLYLKNNGEYHGNLVLKKVSDLLKRNIRASDIVVRYSRDAFCIILSNTQFAPGITLSKRFHAIIRDYPFLHEESQPKGKITVSVGVASFDGQSPEELMRNCETALSAALQKGGNTVEVFENHG